MKLRTAMTARSAGRGATSGSSTISAQAVWQGATIAVLVLFLAAGLFLTMWLVAYPIALLLAAIVLANALAPTVRLFERCVPSSGAIALTYVLVVLAMVAVGWLVIPGLLA